mgnify:CR=1 FL=1
MTSNFALSLSFDGIRLLHRVDTGWNLVGETGLEVADLDGALAQMRADALLLAPDGLRTKLIIPPEQIKFLTLETAQTELGDVLAALDGATPYRVDQLVVDFDRSGGRTYIAAVARETLAEAEAFASEHDFSPAGFAALPEPHTFRGEVFFGPVTSAAMPQTERDAVPTQQTGVAVLPSTGEADTSGGPPPLFTSRARAPSASAAPEPAPDDAVTQAEQAPPAPAIETPEPTAAAPRITLPEATAEAPAVTTPAVATPVVAPPVVATPAVATPVVVASDTATPPAQPQPLSAPPRAQDLAESGGFISRRGRKAAKPAPAAAEPDPKASKKAAAIATKQAAQSRSRPRFLGLILTVILLIFMAIVAVWASTLTEEQLSGWFGFGPASSDIVTIQDPPVPQVVAAAPQADAPDVAAEIDPSNDTAVSALPEAVTDTAPTVRLTETGRILSPAQAKRIYAATGVWQRAPRFALQPRDAEFLATLPAAFAAPADPAPMDLPELALMLPDLPILPPVNPPAAGTDFARDADGFILATPNGTLMPSGVIVYAGPPPKKPPLRAAKPEPVTDAPDGVIVIAGRPSKTPPRRPVFEQPQPENATPTPEDAAPAAVQQAYTMRPRTRPQALAPSIVAAADPALGDRRPKTRPAGLAPPAPAPQEPPTPDITEVIDAIAAAATESPFVDVTARAVRQSTRPDTRPRNFDRVVARAREADAARATARAAAQPQTSASSAPARASGPVPTTVARAATMDNAIRLRDINLIGVYGRPSDRRALIRLGNGRYVKVQVGSRLDGGRVSAIGENVLNYIKRGRTIVLKLPDS